jgi:hypothetical protein
MENHCLLPHLILSRHHPRGEGGVGARFIAPWVGPLYHSTTPCPQATEAPFLKICLPQPHQTLSAGTRGAARLACCVSCWSNTSRVIRQASRIRGSASE